MKRLETQLRCTKEQVAAVVEANKQRRDAFLSILKTNFPVGTRFRQRWLERGIVGDPTFEITGIFILNDEISTIAHIADLEGIDCIGFKKLDSLDRPNGSEKYTFPEKFRFWYEVIENDRD